MVVFFSVHGVAPAGRAVAAGVGFLLPQRPPGLPRVHGGLARCRARGFAHGPSFGCVVCRSTAVDVWKLEPHSGSNRACVSKGMSVARQSMQEACTSVHQPRSCTCERVCDRGMTRVAGPAAQRDLVGGRLVKVAIGAR